MKKNQIVAQFIMDNFKITLTVNFLNSDQKIFSASENIKGLYEETNINRYSNIAGNLLKKANREIGVMISEASVIYSGGNLEVSHDKLSLTSEQIIENRIEESAICKLSEYNQNPEKTIVNFKKYKMEQNHQNNTYIVYGNTYYDKTENIDILKAIFKLAGIKIIALIPKALLISYIMQDKKDFVNINLTLKNIKVNIFKNNMLWSQVVIPNSTFKMIEELGMIYKLKRTDVCENIFTNIHMTKPTETIVYEEKYDQYTGSVIANKSTAKELGILLGDHLEASLEQINKYLIERKLDNLPKIITGHLLRIEGMKQHLHKTVMLSNYVVVDKYHDNKAKLLFLKSGKKYLEDANLLDSKGETNMINTLKDAAYSVTSNHKKITHFKSIISVMNKKIFDLSKF